MLRGDAVQDGAGCFPVLTEQGSSASHMEAAKVLDVISRLTACAGEASDAVSAYTQVKKVDASKLLRLPEGECRVIWIRQSRSRSPKSWDNTPDPVVSLERNVYGHPSAGILRERKFEEILLE